MRAPQRLNRVETGLKSQLQRDASQILLFERLASCKLGVPPSFGLWTSEVHIYRVHYLRGYRVAAFYLHWPFLGVPYFVAQHAMKLARQQYKDER